MNYVYSVDHGNKQLKVALGDNPYGIHDKDALLDGYFHQENAAAGISNSPNDIRYIPAGLSESSTMPTAFNSDVLYYNKNYYTTSEHRIPFLKDKTVDERYFILTLMAIGKKHLQMFPGFDQDDVIPVTLLIGLPPDHYIPLYEKYEKYFYKHGRNCNFILNEKAFSIEIKQVNTYIQAHAAVAPIIYEIRLIPKCIIIDLGGYTADLLQLVFGQPNIDVCKSLEEFGTIQFYNRINELLKKSFDMVLDETDIDRVLDTYPRYAAGAFTTEPTEYDNLEKRVIDLILKQAEQYISDLFSKLRELKIDLKANMPIFVGGGSTLFRKQIDRQLEQNEIRKFRFIDSIRANALGYLTLYQAETAGR